MAGGSGRGLSRSSASRRGAPPSSISPTWASGPKARCFYAIMERGRATAFKNDLPVGQRETVHEAHTGNNKFILLSANCKPAPAPGTQKKSAPAPAEASGGGVID